RRLCQARPGHVENVRRGDRLLVVVVRRELPVGHGRATIEEQRKVVGRPDLAERRRRQPVRVDTQKAHVDTFRREEVTDELSTTARTAGRSSPRTAIRSCSSTA